MRGKLIAGIAALAILAGCAGQPGQPGITLAQAQAEAGVVVSALQAGVAAYSADSASPVADIAKVNAAMADLNAAFAEMKAPPAGATPAQIASTIAEDAQGVVTMLPMQPAEKAAVEAALVVVQAFSAGQSAPVPATGA